MRVAWCLLPVASALACAQVLSYDDYRARESVVVPPDTGVAPDTEPVVADTADVGLPPLHPPARPSGEAKPSGTGKTLWLAIRSYELGTVDPAGINDEAANSQIDNAQIDGERPQPRATARGRTTSTTRRAPARSRR